MGKPRPRRKLLSYGTDLLLALEGLVFLLAVVVAAAMGLLSMCSG